MRMNKSKSWDMRYHWLRDPVLQKEFIVKWAKGIENKANYYTKHFAPTHHVQIRPTLFIPEKPGVKVEPCTFFFGTCSNFKNCAYFHYFTLFE